MNLATRRQEEQVRSIISDAISRIIVVTGNKDVKLALYSGNKVNKSPVDMLAVIAEALGMCYEDYAAVTREVEFVELRRIAVMCLWEYYKNLTYKQIATLVGGCEHTTIIHHIKKAQDMLQTKDIAFTTKYNKAIEAAALWLES